MMIRVYTAGPMNDARIDGRKLARWRHDLEDATALACPGRFAFLHPGGSGGAFGCDHGGIEPETVVADDLDLISKSELVLAWLPRRDLYATCAEIGFAVALHKPVLIYDQTEGFLWEDEHSGHGCPCNGRTAYWFACHLVSLAAPRGRVLFDDGRSRNTTDTLVNALIRWTEE